MTAAEVGLRGAGFEFHRYPTVQFGYPDPVSLEKLYRADPDLLWVTRDYDSRLAQAQLERPAIVFMGDSCTEFGKYPAWTLDRLKARYPDAATGIALGASGWSSYQGLAQLTRDVLRLRPRVVTFYFGWNDHWIALGPPDAQAARSPLLVRLAEHLRIAQLVDKAVMAFEHRDGDPLRVPIDEYRANLTQMVERTREGGGEPVLITAPANHVRGQEPRYLQERHLRQLAALVPLHQSYVAATRQVAGQTRAVLCDAAAAFDGLPQPHDRYFRSDGIHLTDEGDAVMADLVAGCVGTALAQRRRGAQ